MTVHDLRQREVELVSLLGLETDPGRLPRRVGTKCIQPSTSTMERLRKGDPDLRELLRARWMSSAEFVAEHASAYLRRAIEHGAFYSSLLLAERVRHMFGTGFTSRPVNVCEFGDMHGFVDCPPLAQGYEIIDLALKSLTLSDEMEAVHLKFLDEERGEHFGLGVRVNKAVARGIPPTHWVIALVVPFCGCCISKGAIDVFRRDV